MAGNTKKGQKGFQPKDVKDRRKEAAKEHGFSDSIKSDYDMISEMNETLVKANLRKDNETIDEFGFTKDFYKFIGVRKGYERNYRIPLNDTIVDRIETDFASYYTPLDDFYGSPGGGDDVYDQGRIPVSHLVTLCTQRLGIAFRGCNSVANDVFRNKFSFVKVSNLEEEIKNPQIEKILSWMRRSRFWDAMVQILYFERMTGLGHLVGYHDNENGLKKIGRRASRKRPSEFETFSSYYMTPNNIFDPKSMRLDFNKQKWDFTGGFIAQANIHHSRVYVLETRRVEGGLRGLAIPELCWVPLMCYLNTCYYILRSLSQLGTLVIGANVAQEYPSKDMVEKYLELFAKMRANKFFIFGKNMDFKMMNAAGKIGEGINSYLEFLKEDISSAWIIPKNQLFGRAEGGGLEGAGALISKEDYLASNLSTLQLNITDDIMNILENMCHFKGLENLTIRWNLDLHKSEQQRLTEQLMREQLEQSKTQTKMTVIQLALMKLQKEQAQMQFKMFQKNPELLLPQPETEPSKPEKEVDEDQEIETKKPKEKIKSDFMEKQWIIERNHYMNLSRKMNVALLKKNENIINDLTEKMTKSIENMDKLRKQLYK